ncbi:MAG: HAD family hydrolase [Acidimicrobiales bacterium]
MTADAFEAVTFDFWDTLVRADPVSTRRARSERMHAVLHHHGLYVEAEVLDDAFDRAVAAFDRRWAANEQFRGEHAAAVVLDRLEIPVTHPAHLDLVLAFVEAPEGLAHDLAPGIVEVLDELGRAGIHVGIVCDVGLTPSPVLRSYLEAHGVLERFDHWSFSDEVGIYKPAPAIFEHALAGLGVDDPRRALHVGDLRRTDVAGARDMGMVSVRYRGLRDDHPGASPGDGVLADADHVLDDHRELLALLGLASDRRP